MNSYIYFRISLLVYLNPKKYSLRPKSTFFSLTFYLDNTMYRNFIFIQKDIEKLPSKVERFSKIEGIFLYLLDCPKGLELQICYINLALNPSPYYLSRLAIDFLYKNETHSLV